MKKCSALKLHRVEQHDSVTVAASSVSHFYLLRPVFSLSGRNFTVKLRALAFNLFNPDDQGTY